MTSLKEFRDQITFFKKLVAEETDETKKQAFTASLDKAIEQNLKFAELTVKAETERFEKSNDTPIPQQGGNGDKAYDRGVKAISLALKDLPVYNGLNISETERYIAKLNQYYSLLVAEVDKNLEQEFLTLIRLKLGENVWKHIDTAKPDIKNFDKYLTYIRKTYGGQQNAFQVVSRAFDIQFKPEEKFFIYSNKLTNELRSSLLAIKGHYNDKNESDKELTADNCIDFLGALIMSQNLKKDHWEIFRDMTNDMDTLKTANAVAQKAEYYRERVQHAPSSSTFWGRNDNSVKRNDNRNTNVNTNRNDFGVPYNEIPIWYKGNPRIFDPNYRSYNFQNTDKNKTIQKIENKPEGKSFVTDFENKNPFLM
jgi:hypothetical protein